MFGCENSFDLKKFFHFLALVIRRVFSPEIFPMLDKAFLAALTQSKSTEQVPDGKKKLTSVSATRQLLCVETKRCVKLTLEQLLRKTPMGTTQLGAVQTTNLVPRQCRKLV